MRQLSKVVYIAFLWVLVLSPCATAVVFVNEVFINPPGTSGGFPNDTYYEFIELLGTPNKKLDGYAVITFNGTKAKYYPLGSILPLPSPTPEIDQFFSLDGLTLGSNGLLALLVRNPSGDYFAGMLSDSNWVNWDTLWNGGLAPAGTIDNNGSFTISIIRNRPGITEADPCNPNGLRWGKEIAHDAELFTPVQEPNGAWVDQYGDGNLDRADSNGMGGNTIEMTGLDTIGDTSDDLEIVDEVSYEDGQGWEYDTDGRHVDFGSTFDGLPHRHVHALDDPAGINPDAISRVDYRTKGPGWAPSGGGIGEMPGGNNWPDTATEQWVRGEAANYFIPAEGRGGHFYEIAANLDPNAVQPYETHVPLWLDDGNAPDFNFGTTQTFEVAAGRINHLAVPFIPGDTDRDGTCNQNDIDKLASEFGEDDWIFSNSFYDAPEGDGDANNPATQTRPWDVDATGDNGIEASDLQWTLNFQGDTTGQIIGIRYDSNTPAASGVYLNSNADTETTITTSVNIPSGRNADALLVGDIIEVSVDAMLSLEANNSSGQENGIMQFVHDIEISPAGIIEVTNIESLSPFNTTRVSLQTLQGSNGDLGIDLVNGYTTSFTQGLAAPAPLYKITLEVVGLGAANVTVLPAAQAKFAASTPHGIKIGHTDTNGEPDYSVYPAPLPITAVTPSADFDDDNDVDGDDYAILAKCWLTQVGDPDYNPLCDISSPADTKINFLDLDEFVSQWLAGT